MTRDDLQTLRVPLSLKGSNLGSKAIFDHVLLEGNVMAVPEPASTLMFVAAGTSVVGAARRRTRASRCGPAL